jgi:hypothetical protein
MGQGLPLLQQVSLRWQENTAVLLAPGPALTWALENRKDRLQAFLQHYTGQPVGVEVRLAPGGTLRE